jgi:hypothetical protein
MRNQNLVTLFYKYTEPFLWQPGNLTCRTVTSGDSLWGPRILFELNHQLTVVYMDIIKWAKKLPWAHLLYINCDTGAWRAFATGDRWQLPFDMSSKMKQHTFATNLLLSNAAHLITPFTFLMTIKYIVNVMHSFVKHNNDTSWVKTSWIKSNWVKTS